MKTLVKILLIIALVWIAWKTIWWAIGLTFGFLMLAMLFAVPLLIVLGIVYVLRKL